MHLPKLTNIFLSHLCKELLQQIASDLLNLSSFTFPENFIKKGIGNWLKVPNTNNLFSYPVYFQKNLSVINILAVKMYSGIWDLFIY